MSQLLRTLAKGECYETQPLDSSDSNVVKFAKSLSWMSSADKQSDDRWTKNNGINFVVFITILILGHKKFSSGDCKNVRKWYEKLTNHEKRQILSYGITQCSSLRVSREVRGGLLLNFGEINAMANQCMFVLFCCSAFIDIIIINCMCFNIVIQENEDDGTSSSS